MTDCRSDKHNAAGFPDGQANMQLPRFQLSIVNRPPDSREVITLYLNRAEIFDDLAMSSDSSTVSVGLPIVMATTPPDGKPCCQHH